MSLVVLTASTLLVPTALADVAIQTASPLPSGTVGASYSMALSATGCGAQCTWSVKSGTLPPGLGLSAGGVISGTPTAAGTFRFTVQAAQKNEEDEKPFTLAINPAPAPRITTSTLPSGTVGAAYSQALSASGGTPPYSWSISAGALPNGLSLNSAAGAITGVPNTAGTFNFTAKVSDHASATDSKPLSITINAPPLMITTGSPLPSGTLGTAYSQSLSASGGTPPYTWSAEGLPAALTLSAGGMINGIPASAGTFMFTARVTDSGQATASQQFTILIAAGLAIQTASTLPGGSIGAAYSQILAATGGSPPYTWSISSGVLPGGLTLSSGGSLSGIPGTAGTFTFTVQVTDSAQAASAKQFTITIASGLTITTAPELPRALIGSVYSQSLAGAGGWPPYTWSIVADSLPDGLSLSPSGVLSGTPTTAGAFNFTVQLKDSAAAVATKRFTLMVGMGLTITAPAELPHGMLGVAYVAVLVAAGGTQPYSWAITSGVLPGGLTLNSSAGVIAGAPQAFGTFNFTVEVADGARAVSSRNYSLIVAPPDIPPLAIRGMPEVAAPAQQLSVALVLADRYPLPITGSITLGFESDAVTPADDPAVQFSTGGRSVPFTVPANATQAIFSSPEMALQTGTVAGTITIQVSWGIDDTSAAAVLNQSIRINPSIPVIRNIQLQRNSAGFEIRVSGFSTPRELTEVSLRFTPAPGGNLETTEAKVSVAEVAKAWYQSNVSEQFGSQFLLRLPFTVRGSLDAIQSVSLSLSNSQGSSQVVTASF